MSDDNVEFETWDSRAAELLRQLKTPTGIEVKDEVHSAFAAVLTACADEIAELRKEVERLRHAHSKLDAENESLLNSCAQLRELLNAYNLGGWMDSERLIKERDEARQQLAEANKEWRRCAECGYLQKP